MLPQKSLDKLDAFFNRYKPLSYKSRSVISPASDSNSSIFYVKNGYLRVYRLSEQGEELTLIILKPKDFFPLTFGMSATNRIYSYYLEAITSLDVWKVSLEHFYRFLELEPTIRLALTTKVFIRFNDVLSKMEYLVLNNAFTKIVATVISCAKKFGEKEGDSILIRIPLTHKDIATLVGMTRETTSIEMKKLEKQGYIEKRGKYMLIKKIESLEAEIKQSVNNHYLSYPL